MSIKIHLTSMKRVIVMGLLFVSFILLCSSTGWAQNTMVSGTVTNAESGESIADVNISVRGTNMGTTTNADGHYSLQVPSLQDTLVFSFIGYESAVVSIRGRTEINVQLQPTTIVAQELVVVGYGTQKEKNLTGSVSTISTEDLKGVPASSISKALMGKTSGLFIKNVGGQPGDASNTKLRIRGFGEPLIIIDGVSATKKQFSLLNSSAIASISVIKDASAAIYGARAGNGVILVKTKQGIKTEPTLTYRGNFGLTHFTILPDVVSSAQFAKMKNVALFNLQKDPVWRQEQIKKFGSGEYPYRYPNTDWWDLVFKKVAPKTRHTLSLRGGGENVRYYLTGQYYYQEGMLQSGATDDKRYNLRSNIDISVTDNLDVGINLHLSAENFDSPYNQVERRSEAVGIMTWLFRARSSAPAHFPDRTKVVGASPVPYSKIKYVGYVKRQNTIGDVKFSISYDLPFGLRAKAAIYYRRHHISRKEFRKNTPTYNYDPKDSTYTFAGNLHTPSGLLRKSKKIDYINQQYSLRWNKQFNNHNLSALVLFERSGHRERFFQASRIRYKIPLDYLFAGPDLDKDNNGMVYQRGRAALVSRLTYNYKNKYLFEFNSRYDASSRFPSNSRWGFFPSVSVGWRLSSEDFMKDISFLSNLKIRASYGKMGNDGTGSYQFLSTYSIGSSYIFNGASEELKSGIYSNGIPNPSITWEKITIANVGIDFGLFNNNLTGSVDFFYRVRSDVLGQRNRTTPDVIGASLPVVNYEKYNNRGWEISLNYNNTIGDVSFDIGGNVSWSREKTVFVDQPAFASAEVRRRGRVNGRWSDVRWGFLTDGLFQSMEEIRNWADIDGQNNATILPGDLKYVDYNGDGRITDADQVIIGTDSYPNFTYGISAGFSWRQFSFSMLWQGAAMYDINLLNAPDFSIPFFASNTPTVSMLKNSWTPENPWLPTNKSAKWPRYRDDAYNRGHTSFYGAPGPNQLWLIDGSYIRLKNIKVAYSLINIFQNSGLKRFKVYLSAYNILTFSALNFLDPEAATEGVSSLGDYYPPTGTYNVGVVIKF